MFDTVLVANRGEIAVRVIATLRRMGIRSVAVYSDADAGARHVREADVAVRIGPAEAARSYLSIPDVVRAAVETGAQAVHPGYGFLAENAAFASACAEAGLVFIGPPPAAIDAMGDKIRAKETVSAAGVPVVPGRSDVDDFEAAAAEVGYPVLLKPSAGGGGKGMRLVTEPGELAAAVEAAQREARGAFGDDRLLIERFVDTPRHIEVQVLADAHGTVVHLGERECSLQRRHQKIVEEAPSPLLDEAARARMGASAAEAARSVGYVGAGTVEFIVSAADPGEFFFMEMNTRLQVEHPVTEQVTGVDLVEWQVRVAAGEALALSQEDIRLDGHAVEARVYAEDPARGFVPTGGTVLGLTEPRGPHVRVDSGLLEGSRIGSDYDPMLAKVVTWGPDRAAALHRLDRALAGTAVLGLQTNVDFLRRLVSDEDVRTGRLDTGLVERKLDVLTATEISDDFFVAAALDRLIALEPQGPVVDPWDVPSGWRAGGQAGVVFLLSAGGAERLVRVQGRSSDARVSLGDGEPVAASGERTAGGLAVHWGGEYLRYARAEAPDGALWLSRDGVAVAVGERPNLLAGQADDVEGGPVTSPMPGTVLVVKVAEGDEVAAGTPLAVVEAMKMEHTITAPVDGVVAELCVQAGRQVALDEKLALVTPREQTS
ncbi:acetyl/propionyl/methylcrotonyl-CoA carboxylase subunit alpha [Prauserella rugosa]|uniref:Biotin-dependent 3-methylcrotonyl-coenzyme A carboxylase alpha1 subunit n=1 Tax=Prauserella rugosa TaxID=43354 RepID=A0A660CAH4_9PSEU|nr:biotin carboxylase N-terminal domain-containing protein [Prauserella rugosa]KMS92783.1 acetyl-COA carboxylase [Streptomyces regensis]TWH20472.1 acetyl-CoA/propionyl-CoA carboxylase, biotin carboxylase, biotin carboxyl carrier protein [Prauserella rugosa]